MAIAEVGFASPILTENNCLILVEMGYEFAQRITDACILS